VPECMTMKISVLDVRKISTVEQLSELLTVVVWISRESDN
jgi:hypothetical protein